MVSPRLVQLVEKCVRANESEWGEIRAGREKWKHPMFGTVRVLKADPETKNMNERQAASAVEECLSQLDWDFTIYEGIDYERILGREEFMAQWKSCLYGDGEGPLDLALKRARATPVPFQTKCGFAFYPLFLNVCDQLQRITGQDPIALPVHKVGKGLKVTGATVGAYIMQAVEERYLVQVGKHCFNRNGRGKARTYHFYPNRNPDRR